MFAFFTPMMYGMAKMVLVGMGVFLGARSRGVFFPLPMPVAIFVVFSPSLVVLFDVFVFSGRVCLVMYITLCLSIQDVTVGCSVILCNLRLLIGFLLLVWVLCFLRMPCF